MEKLEFHTEPDGRVYCNINGAEPIRLTKFTSVIIDPMLDILKSRFPECYSRLVTLYPLANGTPSAKIEQNHSIVERFIRCNFGENDLLTQDVENDILHFEEVKCPLRGGFCPHEGVVCKPKSMVVLSKAEREVVSLYLEGYTFTDIAEKLKKSPQTVKTLLFRVKNKLNLKNCREIIKVLRLKNF